MAYEFKKLSNVSAVDSVSDNTNVLIEENGTIKKVSKSAVGETAESVISKIAEVPSTTNTTNSTNIIIEENGEIKKVSKSTIQGKRELVYEWNPGIDADGNPVTDIYTFMQNVDDDLSWLTTKNDDVGFEIEVTTYPYIKYWDEENDEEIEIFATDAESKVYANQNSSDKGFFNNNTITGSAISACGGIPYDPIADIEYNLNWIYIYVYNNLRVDEDLNITNVETGGNIQAFVDSGGPFKSIKIYKITY